LENNLDELQQLLSTLKQTINNQEKDFESRNKFYVRKLRGTEKKKRRFNKELNDTREPEGKLFRGLLPLLMLIILFFLHAVLILPCLTQQPMVNFELVRLENY
jgi:hypothetical protein